MKYRHSFHAGNFADVHKHVTLLALIAALQRKDKGFLYLETHAGRGLYDLDSADTHQGAEARLGIGALQGARFAEPADHELPGRARAQSRADVRPRDASYPGSPLLAALALRAQDRGLCCEIQAAECRALERALQPLPAHALRMRRRLPGLRAHLPPVGTARAGVDRSALRGAGATIWQRAIAAIGEVLVAARQCRRRAVVSDQGRARTEPLAGARRRRSCRCRRWCRELWLHPRDARVGLNGSGLLIVNPPYQLDLEMRAVAS